MTTEKAGSNIAHALSYGMSMAVYIKPKDIWVGPYSCKDYTQDYIFSNKAWANGRLQLALRFGVMYPGHKEFECMTDEAKIRVRISEMLSVMENRMKFPNKAWHRILELADVPHLRPPTGPMEKPIPWSFVLETSPAWTANPHIYATLLLMLRLLPVAGEGMSWEWFFDTYATCPKAYNPTDRQYMLAQFCKDNVQALWSGKFPIVSRWTDWNDFGPGASAAWWQHGCTGPYRSFTGKPKTIYFDDLYGLYLEQKKLVDKTKKA